MDITKHLVKPVKAEILGEIVEMKPLRTKHFMLTSRYNHLIAKAQVYANKNEKEGLSLSLNKEEQAELNQLTMDLAFLTLSEISPTMTRDQFDELPIQVIEQVMVVFWKINDPESERLDKAKMELLQE